MRKDQKEKLFMIELENNNTEKLLGLLGRLADPYWIESQKHITWLIQVIKQQDERIETLKAENNIEEYDLEKELREK